MEANITDIHCELCLANNKEFIDIFGAEGTLLQIAPLINQHFDFEVKKGDTKATLICNVCWMKLSNFHEFYLNVKNVQDQITKCRFGRRTPAESNESFDVKSETCFSDRDSDDADETEFAHDAIENNQVKPEEKDEVQATHEESEVVSENEGQLKRTARRSKRKLNVAPKNSTKKLVVFRKETRNSSLESEYTRKSKEYDEKIAKHMKLKCELCDLHFTTFADVRKHYRSIHKRRGYIVCCNKKLFKRVFILDHINSHLNPEYFKCQACSKTFSDKRCLNNHMKRHELGEGKNFKCDQCPKKYARQFSLEQHKLVHKPAEERENVCDECGKAFLTNNLLQGHKKYVHENIYGKMCHICAKVIKGKTQFEKHQLEHAGIVEPKVQCQQCGAWLKHEYSLRKHLRRHEEEMTEHVCNECGKVAPTKGALQSHIKYMHSTKRCFLCNLCGKGFKTGQALKEHMTTHTGERLYTCPHCPKSFNHSANMHAHRKKVHRQEWEEGRKHRGSTQKCANDYSEENGKSFESSSKMSTAENTENETGS